MNQCTASWMTSRRKQTGKSFITAASKNTEYDKVKDAMTSLLCYQLFINAFSSPLIIHQCENNKRLRMLAMLLLTKAVTMKPDGVGGRGGKDFSL